VRFDCKLVGGALAPAVTGFIVQDTGSFVPVLLFSAGLRFVCTLVYITVVPREAIDVEAFGAVPQPSQRTVAPLGSKIGR
jgi:hypothetical protein